MFGSATLDVIIGIIFIFMLVSIICSCIREGIEAFLKTRSAYLEAGIRELLNDKDGTGLAKAFYTHPLIHSLFAKQYKPGKASEKISFLQKGTGLPSYIPAKNFALTLMDIAARGRETDEVSGHPQSPIISIEGIRNNIQNLDNPYVQRAVLTALDASQGNLELAQKKLQDWYDSAMDRVSGWYKRATSWIIFGIGLAVAIIFNINTITIANYLYKDAGARQALVARAESAAKDTSYNSKRYNEAVETLNEINLPIGWENGAYAGTHTIKALDGTTLVDPKQTSGAWNGFFKILLGWLLTAFAAMVGAPVWFDLLNKVMVIRATVKPHEKSPEEGSEDWQKPKTPFGGSLTGPAGINERGIAPLPTAPPQQPQTNNSPNIRDRDADLDSCHVPKGDPTPDEDLPEAKGGVQ
ncbi:MAG: hypothetical protein ABW036_01805 [Flavitalea sp.]